MNRFIEYVLLTLPLLAASCATTPEGCDPGRADFIKNTGCLASGAYEIRQARLKNELAQEQRRNRAFRDVLLALDEEKVAVAADLRASQSRYAKLDATWQRLRADLLRGSSESAAFERQLQSIDEQMARRKNARPADVAQRVRERENLRKRLSLLQSEIDAGVYR